MDAAPHLCHRLPLGHGAASSRGRTVRAAVTVGQGLETQDGSSRLKKARLRLAEAQGIIPAGASDRYESLGGLKVSGRGLVL